MNEYLVWITTGGVMEDPQLKKEDVLTIQAEDPDQAIEKWLVATECDESRYLHRGSNGVGWSYYYPITCIENPSSHPKREWFFNEMTRNVTGEAEAVESYREYVKSIMERIEQENPSFWDEIDAHHKKIGFIPI